MEQQRETESVRYFSLSLTMCRIHGHVIRDGMTCLWQNTLFCITLTCTVLVSSNCYLTLDSLLSILCNTYLSCLIFSQQFIWGVLLLRLTLVRCCFENKQQVHVFLSSISLSTCIIYIYRSFISLFLQARDRYSRKS